MCQAQAQPFVLLDLQFENDTTGTMPTGFKAFHANSNPDVRIAEPGAFGSKKSILARQTSSGGWTSASHPFPDKARRVTIQFDFAFSDHRGRTLNIWTHEPNGRDASQLNIAIQNGALQQYDGRTRKWIDITRLLQPSTNAQEPIWHRLRAVIDQKEPGIDFWVSAPGKQTLPATPITRAAYRTNVALGSIDIVSGQRIVKGGWYMIDNITVIGGQDQPKPHPLPPPPERFTLWTGDDLPSNPSKIPFAEDITHRTIHRAHEKGYKFLHGSAMVHHNGTLYANWANSPVHENGPHEILCGRRSNDNGLTWSDLEIIAPGFDGPERHSHGILFVHENNVWTIAARFGVGDSGKRFRGIQGEAFVLNPEIDRWESKGIVMKNCWPCDQPIRMENGNYITGGMDKDGLPVVAISDGNNLQQWESISIPFSPQLKPSFAETTVVTLEKHVMALIRGGGGFAWVATSTDYGHTWTRAQSSNFRMPRAKAYLGKLSTGQRYLLSNYRDRNTLVISTSKPGENTFSKIWRIRDGESIPPRFPGHAKSKQWSYPYGYEYNENLYVVYSIGKEDCGMSIIPLSALKQ